MSATFSILVVLLLVSIGTMGGRHSSFRSTSTESPKSREKQPEPTVVYKGVSFTLDPSLASEVKSETIPASIDGKPSDIWPEHSAFTFTAYALPKSLAQSDPQIRVFPLAEFRRAVQIASDENRKSVVSPKHPPSWTIYFDEELRTLKALLAKRPSKNNLRSVIVNARKDRSNTQMPFLPMWEATQAFRSHVEYVEFKNGKGVFFLTQWDPSDTSPVSNEGLEYAFQGLTNDGRYLVYAEFSVKAPFLPQGDEPWIANWISKNYLLPHESKKYQKYLRPVVSKLEALPASQFQPNLGAIEKMIRSLQVKSD